MINGTNPRDQDSDASDDHIPSIILTEEEMLNWRSESQKMILRMRDGDELYSRLEKRVIIRPKINWPRCFLLASAFILPLLLMLVIMNSIRCSGMVTGLMIAMVLCVWLVLAKPLLIQAVQLYQAFAREETRRRCKCFPSCSEYAIESLEKHGLLKGLYLGVRRAARCGIIRGDDPVP
jgi:putative component of membrane protein insertase Oxa1/YidC/SpoIIIJ protein YidD